jgi:hypothetical protein
MSPKISSSLSSGKLSSSPNRDVGQNNSNSWMRSNMVDVQTGNAAGKIILYNRVVI